MADEAKEKANKKPQRFGRFEVIAHIASGGMGAVYKAFDPKEKCVVALKVMSPELAAKNNMIKRFQREARSSAKLKHENIVSIKEFGEANGTFYLAQEFVDGKDLHDYITRSPGGRVDFDDARQIALQAARALDCAHRAGVVHRDVKPSNFLVVKQPGPPLVKLTDFGLARHADDDEHRVTKVGTTLGTVDYMAPEQARDSYKADIRSDLYALGSTIVHMLTGRAPFPKGTLAEKIVQLMEAEPPDLCKVNEAVPKTFGLIVRKLLAKDPRDRYQTPAELIDELEAPEHVLVAKEAPAETNESPVEKPERKPRKPIERAASAAPEPVKPKSSEILVRRKSRKSKTPVWLPVTIGGGAMLLVGIIVLIVVKSFGRPVQEVKPEPKIVETKPEPIVVPPVKEIVGPAPLELKPLFEPLLPLDVGALTKEFYGPFAAFPEAPAQAKVITISRLPLAGIASVRTLAEACAQASAGATTVLEFRDQGPHFLASLPAVAQRSLWIRGGPGVRPLLFWDGAGAANLLTLNQGQLTLDNLDVVMHGPAHDGSACLFHVQGGSFRARACTFSVAGKHPHGVCVARLQGTGSVAPPGASAGDEESTARFTRCCLRGQDIIALETNNTPADVLLDAVAAVGGGQPLLWHRNREEEPLTVRIVRSTLVTQQQLWRWQPATGQGGSPRVKMLVWDAILARAEGGTTDGDLLQFANGARMNLASFRPVNCLYAGWRNLLAAGDKTCTNLNEWRAAWGHREGDLVQAETWPPRGVGIHEEVPAASLHPGETPAAFTATGGRGPIGCALGLLPPEPPFWKQRTVEPYAIMEASLPDADAPEIPTSSDGLYHGEKIELGKVDLGAYIQTRLQTLKPGPRVVLRLTGKGAHATTPLRFRGVEHLVIHFQQPAAGAKEKAEPLTLELKPGGAAVALIEVDGGSLEIQHGRFRYENSRIAVLPPHLIRVRGGDVRLSHCALLGPLSKAPDSFQSLIAVEGSGVGAAQPVHIGLRDCVLQSGKPLIDLKNPGVRVRCRGCLLYALGDALAVDLGALATSRPDIAVSLEHNTVVLRQALVHLRSFEGPSACLPVVLQTQANYFLDPFPDEPRQSCLVKLTGDNLAHGLLLWQGKNNVFARDQLQSYYQGADGPVGRQSFKDWQKFTGPIGEVAAHHIDPLPVKMFNADQPAYDRLAVPPTLRLEPMPGADLAKLGLGKKK